MTDEELIAQLRVGPEYVYRFVDIDHAAADRIVALKAERDEAECEKDRLAEINRNLCNSHNILLVDGSNWQARAEAAEAEAAAFRAKLARIASAWPIVRDADCSGGTLASAMDEIEAAISDGAADE